MFKKYFILFLIMFCINSLSAQIEWTEHLGGRVGVILQFGKPVNRIGLVANVFYHYDFAQLNLEWKGYHNFSNFGPPKKGWEMRTTTGLTLGFGNEAIDDLPFAFPIFHQTKRRYSITYNLHFYHDQIETSQRAGSIALQFHRIFLLLENDAFGSVIGADNFRTGGFSIFYHHTGWLFELKTAMWTGKTKGKYIKDHFDTDYPCRWGYRDICNEKYGRFSHGVLGFQVHRALKYGQVVQVGIGIDSEHVRNVLQNKFLHDLYFVPQKWTKVKMRHFPMLMENGEPYLYQEGQKVRSARWYLNLGVNGEGLY